MATTPQIEDTQDFYQQMEQWAKEQEHTFPRALPPLLWGLSFLAILSVIVRIRLGAGALPDTIQELDSGQSVSVLFLCWQNAKEQTWV